MRRAERATRVGKPIHAAAVLPTLQIVQPTADSSLIPRWSGPMNESMRRFAIRFLFGALPLFLICAACGS